MTGRRRDRCCWVRRSPVLAHQDDRGHDLHVAIENWQYDLNFGTVVRIANARVAAEVHTVGLLNCNGRGATIIKRHQHFRHHPAIEQSPDPGSVPYGTHVGVTPSCPKKRSFRAASWT